MVIILRAAKAMIVIHKIDESISNDTILHILFSHLYRLSSSGKQPGSCSSFVSIFLVSEHLENLSKHWAWMVF